MPVKTPDSANDFKNANNDRWRPCHVCGSSQFKGIIYFESGSVAPTTNETVTGATSGDTGVVEAVYLRSGSYAGGDAAGCLEFSSVTGGERENYTAFQANEILNGSVSGANFATAARIGSLIINGVLYPETIEYRGKYYCPPHFAYRFGLEWKQESIHKTGTENDRSYD